MRGLTREEILRVWEGGLSLSPPERALFVLTVAEPERGWDELARLPIGQRDMRLAMIRERTFGPSFEGYLECSHCGERLECAFPADALTRGGEETGGDGGYHPVLPDGGLTCRLPNSYDLLAVDQIADPERAARELAIRCVRDLGDGANHEPLGAEVELALCRGIEELDPQAETLVEVLCQRCGQHSVTLFDMAEFLWREVRAYATRVLLDVHTLARAYGWRESDILAMTDARRDAYLDLVT